MTTAPSVETRVLVLRLLKVIATVFPVRAPSKVLGTEPDLRACLRDEALRIRAMNSEGVRSAIERRCLGAKGEVGGVEGVEYARH